MLCFFNPIPPYAVGEVTSGSEVGGLRLPFDQRLCKIP